jgi:AmmeMemoRadiSam system protein B
MQIRNAAVAGMFYPDDAVTLAGEIDSLLAGVSPDPGMADDRLALVVPHAGYVYSGAVAAAAYGLLAGRSYDLVVLLGPSHRVYLRRMALPGCETFRTPLGDLPVDRETAERLTRAGQLFAPNPDAHRQEHSLEVQLPFLQRSLAPGFRILPMVTGDFGLADVETAAALLDEILPKERVLVIASTDLSHDHPYDEAVAMDGRCAALVTGLDYRSLAEAFERREAEACGAKALLVLMAYAERRGLTRARILAQTNSGDVVGDRDSRIVGYLAAVFSGGETVDVA